MKKQDILNLFLILVVGSFGGLVCFYLLYQNNLFLSPVVINQSQERVYIEENTALTESIKETKKTIFIIKQGTQEFYGLILTSDGLAVTLSSNLGKTPITCEINGESSSCQILKRDLNQNLALIKIERDRLSTLGFYNPEIEMGKRIYVLSLESVNEGIVKSIDLDSLKTNIRETEPISGSPAFSLDNKIIGLAEIDKNGFVSIVPVSVIRTFVGL